VLIYASFASFSVFHCLDAAGLDLLSSVSSWQAWDSLWELSVAGMLNVGVVCWGSVVHVKTVFIGVNELRNG